MDTGLPTVADPRPLEERRTAIGTTGRRDVAEGTVVFFGRRHGYIRPDSRSGLAQPEPDLYVHASAVQMNSRRVLTEGQRVSFDVGSRSEEFIVECMLGNAAYVHEEHFGKPDRQAVKVTPLTTGDERSDLQRAEAMRQARGGRPYTPPSGPADLDPSTMRWPGRGVVHSFNLDRGHGAIFMVDGIGRGMRLWLEASSFIEGEPAAVLKPGCAVAYRMGSLPFDWSAAQSTVEPAAPTRRKMQGMQALDVTVVAGQEADQLRTTARSLLRDSPYGELGDWPN